MTPEMRTKLEYQIVGSCLVDRSNIAMVTQYVTTQNMVDPDAKAVMRWMAEFPDIHLNAGGMVLSTIRQDTGVKAVVLAKMLMAGSVFYPLANACLLLLESCFRAEAIKILKANREKVLIPLAPIEKDIENPANDVWQMVTAAANYCTDVDLNELAELLTQLLGQMNQRAGLLKENQRAGMLVQNLKTMALQNPQLMKPYVNDFKEILDATR